MSDQKASLFNILTNQPLTLTPIFKSQTQQRLTNFTNSLPPLNPNTPSHTSTSITQALSNNSKQPYRFSPSNTNSIKQNPTTPNSTAQSPPTLPPKIKTY
jgi:hypothetical protein